MREVGSKYWEGLHELMDYLVDDGCKMETVVEIGTHLGESAVILAKYFDRVITYDPWEPKFLATYGYTVEQVEEIFARTTLTESNIFHYREPSLVGSTDYAERTVDFVYIDGWHRVIPVVVDIMAWLPKIKRPGWIGGHDYTTHDYSEVIPGVMYTLGEPDATFSDTSWVKKL